MSLSTWRYSERSKIRKHCWFWRGVFAAWYTASPLYWRRLFSSLNQEHLMIYPESENYQNLVKASRRFIFLVITSFVHYNPGVKSI